MNASISEFCDCIDSRLDVVRLISEYVLHIRCKRCSGECRHKDCLWPGLRICKDSVRPLDERWPKSAFEKDCPDVGILEVVDFLRSEVKMFLLCIRFDSHFKKFPLFTSDNGLDCSADRRSEENLRGCFVCKDRCSAQNLIAFLHEKFGYKTSEVGGFQCNHGAHNIFLCLLDCTSRNRNVQPLFQLNVV